MDNGLFLNSASAVFQASTREISTLDVHPVILEPV